MKLNKWYYRDNEYGDFTLFFPIKKDKDYYYGTMIEDDDIDFESGFEPYYFKEDFKEIHFLEVKGYRYTIFDELYKYIGEVNL